jgi:hypothetical protein
VLPAHGLFAAKGEGDVNVLGEAEELADAKSELLEAGGALLDRNPKDKEGGMEEESDSSGLLILNAL